MTALSDLIARLEAAKEGSRELDALIFTEVFEAELRPWSSAALCIAALKARGAAR